MSSRQYGVITQWLTLGLCRITYKTGFCSVNKRELHNDTGAFYWYGLALFLVWISNCIY